MVKKLDAKKKINRKPKDSAPSGHARCRPTDRTRAEVIAMSEAGIPHTRIANALKISLMTLRKYYGEELERASLSKLKEVAGFLFENAKAGNVAAQIFWMKAQGGWSEKATVQVSGAEGNPIKIEWVSPKPVVAAKAPKE